MKTLKTIFLVSVLFLSTCLVASNSVNYYKSDTLRINTEKGAQMIMIINDLKELKHLEEDVNIILQSVERVINEIGAFDTVVSLSVDKLERKIILDGSKDGESKVHSINISRPMIEREPKNLHGYLTLSAGMNNYLENGKFPNDSNEQYAVNAFRSWSYVVGGGMRWYMSSSFSLDLDVDVSWYNFKFRDESTRISTDNDEISFSADTADYKYTLSKIRVPYVNASIIPMFHFGSAEGGLNRKMFRVGAGFYGGYRIGGRVHYEFESNNTSSVYKASGDYYLNSYRYGVTALFGVKELNVFASYDLNTLFAEGKGPELNPFTFGINWKF